MKNIINAFTMGHPKQMIGPALCHFFEGLTISFPAVAVYFAINLLAEDFANPAALNMYTLRIICIVMGGLFAVIRQLGFVSRYVLTGCNTFG